MNDYTIEVVKQYREDIEQEISRGLQLQFEKVLEVYIEANYPDNIDERSLMCSLHLSFEDHNCVGCNLNVYSDHIMEFLVNYNSFKVVSYTMCSYILSLYLMVERFMTYIRIMGLNEDYRKENFKIFQTIYRWANFIKHPKSFMLVHHPIYIYEGFDYDVDDAKNELLRKSLEARKIIDTKFISKYYAGKGNNDELYMLLYKQTDYVVVFPNPEQLMIEFVEAQRRFVELIQNDESLREKLESEATIKNHFEKEEE